VLAVVLASVFFWLNGVESQNDRLKLLVVMVVVTALHSAAFVIVNADRERSIARFEILPDGRLWGSNARAYAYEDLSAYYRDRRESARASEFTEKCLAADSTSSRRWVNASVVFQTSGEKQKEIRAYEKAIQLGTGFAWVYGNLGSEYITLGRIDEADTLLHKALELDPGLPMAAYNLGSLLGNMKHNYEEGFYFLSRAVETDSTFASAWLNAGTCLYELRRFREMVPYYERFVQLAPDHPLAPDIKRLIESVKPGR
jgi:tetratricopeptide (TPR) repeat protein